MKEQVSIDNVIQERLSRELGAVTGKLIEAQVYNEALIQQLEQAKKELDDLKSNETGEAEPEELNETEEGE